jgi:hypothetical protein
MQHCKIFNLKTNYNKMIIKLITLIQIILMIIKVTNKLFKIFEITHTKILNKQVS